MKFLQIGIASVTLASLVSCSAIVSDKRMDYGAGAKQAPNLEVPPDLTVPSGDGRYKVPQGDGGTAATFSDYSKGGDAKGRAVSTVLPEMPGVRLERNGAQRWLVVSDSAEKVWSVVKAFMQEVGLTIISEDQAAGVLETDWAENRAKIPQSKIRDVIGKVFDKAYSSGERDQYLVRLERGDEKFLPGQPKDGASTRVYITHRGKGQVFAADMSTVLWQLRASDPEMEAIMLQRLMVRFGVNEAQAASAVAQAGTVTAASAVPSVMPGAMPGSMPGASVAEPAGTASLREIHDGGVVIVMNDAFDRSWRKVGLAIESAALAVEDKDREKGIYFLRPIKVERSWLDALKFWKSNLDTENHYRVNVKDGKAVCEVSVTDQNGAGNTVTKQMTEAIFKHINQ